VIREALAQIDAVLGELRASQVEGYLHSSGGLGDSFWWRDLIAHSIPKFLPRLARPIASSRSSALRSWITGELFDVGAVWRYSASTQVVLSNRVTTLLGPTR
jgi:hypothetical protein